MSSPTDAAPDRRLPSRGDRGAILVFVGAGVGIALAFVVAAVLRLVELVSQPSVSVPAAFGGDVASLPIGPGGEPVEVQVTEAIITTSSLDPVSLGALITGVVVTTLAVVALVACLIALSLGVRRGEIFSRRNTRLAGGAAAGLVAAAADPFFRTMGSNGAFAAISNGDFDNVIFTADPFTFILAAFAIAIVGSAFSVGERLQRDTEGLV
ncbi:MAG: hypothetical protein ACXIUP_04780 [Microcella sp.]